MSKIKANTIENVAGTETHSVDTMGIISGSNANGYYVKYPDGTLLMYGEVALAQQSTYLHVALAGGMSYPILPLAGSFKSLTGDLLSTPAGADARNYGILVCSAFDTNFTIAITADASRDLSTLWGLSVRWQFMGRWK